MLRLGVVSIRQIDLKNSPAAHCLIGGGGKNLKLLFPRLANTASAALPFLRECIAGGQDGAQPGVDA
jgi:hypothetical protein